jgi:hypothetical protein
MTTPRHYRGRSREEDAAVLRDQKLLHTEIGDAEHQHIVESLAGRRIHRVAPAAAMAAEQLAVGEVSRPTVLGQLLRRLRQLERELVEIGHRRHGAHSATRP